MIGVKKFFYYWKDVLCCYTNFTGLHSIIIFAFDIFNSLTSQVKLHAIFLLLSIRQKLEIFGVKLTENLSVCDAYIRNVLPDSFIKFQCIVSKIRSVKFKFSFEGRF